VTGVGYNGHGEVICEGRPSDGQSQPALSKVLEVGCICNNAEISDDRLHGQPTEEAFLASALKVSKLHTNTCPIKVLKVL